MTLRYKATFSPNDTISVECRCGWKGKTQEEFWGHIPICQLDRCAHCLLPVNPPYQDPQTGAEHVCPLTRIAHLKRDLQELAVKL